MEIINCTNEPTTNTDESDTSYVSAEEFLESCFQVNGEMSAETAKSIAEGVESALSFLEELRRNDDEAFSHDRRFIAEMIEVENPIVARLVKSLPPDFEELNSGLQLTIEENSRVKEQLTMMFDKTGKPRPGKINGFNVVKMTLLRMRPLLVFAIEQDLVAVQDFNEKDVA